MGKDDFMRRTTPFAVPKAPSAFGFALLRLSPIEFREAAKQKTSGLPLYWTEFDGASYFWPKRTPEYEINWQWDFDEEAYRRARLLWIHKRVAERN